MVSPPDSPLVTRVVASPNHGGRRGVARPDMLLLHYTGMLDADAALARLCDPEAEVSSHYFVYEDGRIVQMVAEARRAWHAGVSSWAGESDVNSHSIGIEIANPGEDFGYPDFPEVQIAAVTALCRDMVARNRIPAARVLAHSDVAPGRKDDPGEKFPWARLHRAGVGLWVEPVAIGGPVLSIGDGGPAVRALQQHLTDYGYGVTATGHYDETTAKVVAAFQRHFRPARVDGVADESTVATLARLMAAHGAT